MNNSESGYLIVILVALVLIVALGLAGFLWYGATVVRQRAFLESALAVEQAAQAKADAAIEEAKRSSVDTDDSTKEATDVAIPKLRIISWNIESDGNDPAVIAQQLVELGRYDIVALQEVHSRNVDRYGNAIRNGISDAYRYFASHTGRSDRVMIIFDSDHLRLTQSCELFSQEGISLNNWRHRSPLVAHFTDRQTSTEFLFLTAHLARGDAKFRNEQARGLREWARDAPL